MRKTIALSLIISFLITVSATAQKLPNIQEASLRAPTSIKVDGKATEWNNQFQAYNKAIEAYYTICNDQDKLYFAIEATDLDIANKVICAGITFTINGSGRMKDEGGNVITFPILNKKDFPITAPPINYDNSAASMNDELTHDPDYSEKIPVVGKVPHLLNKETATGMDRAKSSTSRKILLKQGLRDIGVVDGNIRLRGEYAPRIESLISPTDFWGEYTLAK